MAKTTEAKTLVKKLVEILADLGPIEKTKRNPHFGYNYTSEGQIMAALRDRLSSRGVFLFTSVESIIPHYGEPKTGVFVCVQTKHTFVDADTKEEFVVHGAGVGWDSGDKGAYKAITGAMKYMLMKNFLTTDESDPETGEQAPSPAQAGSAGHRRTRAYEEETGAGDQKAQTDLIELKAFLTEHHIPDGFLLRMLQEKELIDGHTKTVAGLKPGVLLRCLAPKSKENLLRAYKEHLKEEGPAAKGKGKKKKSGASVDFADGNEGAAEETVKGEIVRTNEGDQTRPDGRNPVDEGIDPADLLEQEGYDNWREVKIHFGAKKGSRLGDLSAKDLMWWIGHWTPKPWQGDWDAKDLVLDAALVLSSRELGGAE